MPAACNASTLFARGQRFCHVVQQRCGKYNFAVRRRKLAPPPVFNLSFANHPGVNPDVALGVINRILRAALHIAHELKLIAQRVPIEAPVGRFWRKGKVHRTPPKMSQPARSRFGMIGRSVQWLPESETDCRKLARTSL